MTTNHTYRGLLVLMVLLGLVLSALALLVIGGAKAVSAQPYGGCKEAWQAPRSAGAQDCRDAGWTVRPRIVVNPKGWVKHNRLPACKYEDSRNCYWDARSMGNGGGRSFYDLNGRTFYVRGGF